MLHQWLRWCLFQHSELIIIPDDIQTPELVSVLATLPIPELVPEPDALPILILDAFPTAKVVPVPNPSPVAGLMPIHDTPSTSDVLPVTKLLAVPKFSDASLTFSDIMEESVMTHSLASLHIKKFTMGPNKHNQVASS